MSKRNFLFLISIFIQCCALAQQKNISLKHITSQQGLSDNQVTCMLRDKQGFMWIGTKDGLNRFDGRDCYVFRHDENNPASLCGNNITTLAYDDDSVLWVGTASSGVCAFDFRTQRFTTYNKNTCGINSNNINVIRFDKSSDMIWIGYNNGGMQLFDVRKRIFSKRYETKINSIYDILLHDTTAYVASIINSLKKASSPDAFQRKKYTGKAAITINCILNASNSRLYCGAWDNALHEFDYDTRLLKSYIFDGTDSLNFSADEIISIAEDDRGILWCGTKTSGIFFFDLNKKVFTTAYGFEQNISGRINSIYRDDFGRMWICSNQGIYLYDNLQNQFELTRLIEDNKNINCKVHQRVVLKGGTEYIASDCGLFYKTKSDEQYRYKKFMYANEELQLTSIYCDDDEHIFIGSNKTIFILDTIKMELRIMPVAQQSANMGFFSIYASRVNVIGNIQLDKRNFLLSSFYGQYITLIDLQRKNYFWLCRTEPNYIENLVRKIHIDSKKRIWICGASRGLSQFVLPAHFHPDSFPVYDTVNHPVYITSTSWENEKSKTPFAINDVYDILENNDGSFWLASQGNGLIKFFPENTNAPFKPYKGEYKSLQGMARGHLNTLWFISSKGLLSYNTKTEKYKLYGAKHGIPESTSGYFFNESDSTLSAGFNGGFISFNPQKILKDIEKPKVHITKLWVLDAPSDSLLTQEIILNHDKNFLKFYLSSNCFSDNDQVTYMYRLTGIDDNWRNNEFSPFITYTNLPPGNFELKFKAINSDGVESDEGSLLIVITPPFYRAFWFYILIAILLFAGAYIFYRYRIRQILKLQEVRNKIARDLHDDIGSTLGSIHLYSQIANTKLNGHPTEEIKSILEKIETSSAEIIDKTSDVVWAAKASNDALKNLVMRMEAYAASLLGTTGISFRIIFDESLAETKLGMTERKNIFLIFKEAIHNIIKYAGATEVVITISKRSKRIHIQISDNGKGMPVTGDYSISKSLGGNGIKNMKERTKEMNGEFMFESQVGKGTTVAIII